MQIPPFNSLDRVVGVLLPPSFLVLLFPLHWNASLPPPAALTDPDMFSMSSFLFWSLWQNLIHLFSLMNFAFILEITNLLYQIKVAFLLQPKTTSQWRNRESWKRRVDFNFFLRYFRLTLGPLVIFACAWKPSLPTFPVLADICPEMSLSEKDMYNKITSHRLQ